MTLRDDIKSLDDLIGYDPAWKRIKALIPLPVQTTQEQFLDFPVGQKFTTPDDSMYTFVKVGEISAVQIRKSDGNPRFFADMFTVDSYDFWAESTLELKAAED